MRFVALIGDGHTHLDLPPSSLRYPIEMQWFGDELRVIAAQAPYHSAVGARVLAIGSTPIRDVMERAMQLVPRGENDGRTRLTATMQLTSPEVLHGLGVIADRANAPFALELATGERTTIDAFTGTVRRFFHLANGNGREATALSAAIGGALVDRVSA